MNNMARAYNNGSRKVGVCIKSAVWTGVPGNLVMLVVVNAFNDIYFTGLKNAVKLEPKHEKVKQNPPGAKFLPQQSTKQAKHHNPMVLD